MRTECINSNSSNFKGQLIYVDSFGKQASRNILQRFPQGRYSAQLKRISKMLNRKKYNVFVTYNRHNDEFVLDSGRNYKEAVKIREFKNNVSVHKSNPIAIPWAAEDAIKEHTQFLQFNKIRKKLGINTEV